MDLGTKYEESEGPAQVGQSEHPDFTYPSFQLSSKPAEEFMEEHGDLEVGAELTVTMRLRLTTLKDSEARYDSGKRVEFDCLSMDNVKPGAKDVDGEDESGESNPSMRRLMKEQEE